MIKFNKLRLHVIECDSGGHVESIGYITASDILLASTLTLITGVIIGISACVVLLWVKLLLT